MRQLNTMSGVVNEEYQAGGLIQEENDQVSPLGGSAKSMPIASSTVDQEGEQTLKEKSIQYFQGWSNRVGLARYQKLVTEEHALKYSTYAVRFNVMMNAINTKMLNPNFAILASKGTSDDSFDNTNPFDFNSATYFMPLCSLLGVAIASIFTGKLSDKIGRKKVIWFCSVISGFGSLGMYFARHTFWGFCIMSFVAGLFRGTLPVGMAYVSDVYTTKQEKSDQLGVIVAYFVLGNSGGGILAILMKSTGLFTPLLLGAALIWLSCFVLTKYMIEQHDVKVIPIGKEKLAQDFDDDDENARPEVIDECTLWNIIGGALADNVGSTALFPLCLSPLALEQYTLSPSLVKEIMSVTLYQWLSVLVALMVIPGTLITPWVFKKIGASGGCVMGNVCTGLLTIALLLIANGPQTTVAFVWFVIVMYLGFPLTVISQLSTGPMLDVIAPLDKLGYVQGLNNTVMNLGMAVAPWVLGILADALGTNPAIWIGVGVSFLAGLINVPLMFKKGLGPEEKKPPPERRVLQGEDEDLVDQALRGEWVPAAALADINENRIKGGQPPLAPQVTSYDDDKEDLKELRAHAHETFLFRKQRNAQFLSELANPENTERLPELVLQFQSILEMDEEIIHESHEKLGNWFGDYLKASGYAAHVQPVVIKQMIMSAFPTVLEEGKEITPENFQQILLHAQRVYNQYLDIPEENPYSLNGILATRGTTPVGYFS